MKLLRTAAIAVLLMGSLWFGASSVAAASYGGCQGDPTSNYHTGMLVTNTGQDVKGVLAYIDPGTWHLCNNVDFSKMSSAYISLENPSYPGSILQVGVILCGTGNIGCPYGDQMRFFWSRGGCGYGANINDLGAANYAKHKFVISLSDDALGFNIQIDDVQKVKVLKNHGSLNCWIDHPRSYAYTGERWDWGDGLGDSSQTGSTWITSTTVRFGGSWSQVYMYAPCNFAEGGGGHYSLCATYDTPAVRMWTTY